MGFSNSRGTTLLSVPGKILSNIIYYRMMEAEQTGMRKGHGGLRSAKSCATHVYVLRHKGQTNFSGVDSGVWQGVSLSPLSFIIVLDYVLKKIESVGNSIERSAGGKLRDLAYADDTDEQKIFFSKRTRN